MKIKTEKTKQGCTSSLFPNLGMKVIVQGCVAEIVQVSSQQMQFRILENFNSSYKVGNLIWNDSFLIYEDLKLCKDKTQ